MGTLGALHQGVGLWKWCFWAMAILGGIGLQLGTGYLVAFCVYQFGTLVTTGALGTAFVPGLVIVAAFVGVLAYLIMKATKDVAAEYALKSKPAQV